MVQPTIDSPPANPSISLGAMSNGDTKLISLRDDGRFVGIVPADAVTITSPRTATGGAALLVKVNGSSLREFAVVGGGASRTEPGPVYQLEITALADVAGSGTDNVFLTVSGRPRGV